MNCRYMPALARIGRVTRRFTNEFGFAITRQDKLVQWLWRSPANAKNKYDPPLVQEVAAKEPRRTATQNRVPNSLPDGQQPVIRCAIYARYSSKLQRESSIEDQIRNCRRAAEQNGWLVLDEYIRF